MRVYANVSIEDTPVLGLSYHCLGADTVCSVNPDVFGHNFAMLREIEVFLQLETRNKVSQRSQSENRAKFGLGEGYVCSIRDSGRCSGHFRGLLIRDLRSRLNGK